MVWRIFIIIAAFFGFVDTIMLHNKLKKEDPIEDFRWGGWMSEKICEEEGVSKREFRHFGSGKPRELRRRKRKKKVWI